MKLKALPESVGLESPGIGNKRQRLFNNKATIEVPGSKSSLIGFNRWAKNKEFIVLLTELENGQVRQIGSFRFPASIDEMTPIIEAAVEGGNKTTYVFADKSVIPGPVYLGAILDLPQP